MLKIRSGGFVFAEFAIALPLLILLGWGLATVGIEIFKLGRDQLADYVLEAEAQYVMERITHQARAAREIKITRLNAEIDEIKIVYHTIAEEYNRTYEDKFDGIPMIVLFDSVETQYFITYTRSERDTPNLYAQRQNVRPPTSPITGENFFGDTKISSLKFDLDKATKILHVSLEMESLITERKIKLNTAVFVPGYEP